MSEISPGGATPRRYGHAVAIVDDLVVVSATTPLDTNEKVYFFRFDATGAMTLLATLEPDMADIKFGEDKRKTGWWWL